MVFIENKVTWTQDKYYMYQLIIFHQNFILNLYPIPLNKTIIVI
jgi:hypothetical protein